MMLEVMLEVRGWMLEVRRQFKKCRDIVGATGGSSAITLVALVITIVVLLILAGVTISLTLGERGIFTTAQRAAQNYKDAQDRELAELDNFENLMNNTISRLNNGAQNVPVTNPVTGVSVSPETITLTSVGATANLIVMVSPANADDKIVTWETSNANVASVVDGVITAVGAGKCNITATSNNGLVGTCNVMVALYTEYNVGEIVTVKEVEYYVMTASDSTEQWVTLLRKTSYGSYTWWEARAEALNYASLSPQNFTTSQASSWLASRAELEGLTREIRNTGSYYWTSTDYATTSAYDIESGNFSTYTKGTKLGTRPVLKILKSLI